MSALRMRAVVSSFCLAVTASFFAIASLLAACAEEETDDDDDTNTQPDGATDDAPSLPRIDGANEIDSATCAEIACSAASYKGVVALAGCCAASGACGLDLAPLGALMPVPSTCAEVAAPGSPSVDCIGVEIERDGAPSTVYAGCCRANGTCGIAVRIDTIDFGCQPPDDFIAGYDGGVATPCAFDGGAVDGGSDAGADASDTDADTDADAG